MLLVGQGGKERGRGAGRKGARLVGREKRSDRGAPAEALSNARKRNDIRSAGLVLVGPKKASTDAVAALQRQGRLVPVSLEGLQAVGLWWPSVRDGTMNDQEKEQPDDGRDGTMRDPRQGGNRADGSPLRLLFLGAAPCRPLPPLAPPCSKQ